MEREILAKDSIIADLNEKITKLEKEKTTKTVDWSKIFSSGLKNTSQETLLLAKVAKETKQKNSKENNVIISGIQESSGSLSTDERKEHDKNEINKILNAIQVGPSKMTSEDFISV
jgi:cell division septum initiation protein DivIVA